LENLILSLEEISPSSIVQIITEHCLLVIDKTKQPTQNETSIIFSPRSKQKNIKNERSRTGKVGLSTCIAIKIEKGEYLDIESDPELIEKTEQGRLSVFVPLFS